MFAQFINEYGTMILYTLLTALFGYLGIIAKKIVDKYLNDKTKRAVAESCVQFVEQVYKDLHGEEKFNQALTAMSEMLAEKGITCSELEMRVLIEAALASFNNAFENGDGTSGGEITAPEDEASENAVESGN